MDLNLRIPVGQFKTFLEISLTAMALDMDLCCLLDLRTDPPPSASQFVLRASQLLERETKFTVKPLPNARLYPFPSALSGSR